MNNHVYVDLLYKSIKENYTRPCMYIKRDGEYQTWTYEDFFKDINRLSSALKKHKYQKNDKIIVIGDNTPEWVITWHCGFIAGGITVPVDPNLPANEIREIIIQSSPKFVFCSKGYQKLFEEILNENNLKFTIVITEPKYMGQQKSFYEFICEGDSSFNAFETQFNPDDIALLIFTSGTTGKAKGVMLAQKNLTAISLYAIPRMKVFPGDTMLAVLPLHHVFGACACLAGALGGGLNIVLIPTVKGSLILEGLRDKNASILPAVPKLLQVFYNNIKQNVKSKGITVRILFAFLKFLSITLGSFLGHKFRKKLFSTVHKNFGGKLDIIISGGAAIQRNIFIGLKLMGFRIVEGYGLSETFGAITLCPVDDARIGSVGIPLEENEVKISNPNESGIGEVCFKGINVFAGYYNNPELTKKAFDENGWFYTGDLGKVDKDGFIYLSGRCKDVIVLESGKNVYPDELEDYYSQSEIIEEIGIFSAKHNNKEIAAALIVPKEKIRKNHTVLEAKEIIRNEILLLSRNLPSYKKISDFEIIYEPLPRTTTKKLKKHELREIYYSIKEANKTKKHIKIKKEISAAEKNIMETEEYRLISSIAVQLANKNENIIYPPFADLETEFEFDSIKKIEFICEIEQKFKITIPDEAIINLNTIGDTYLIVTDLLTTQKITPEKDSFFNIKQRIFNSNISVSYPSRVSSALNNTFSFITLITLKNIFNIKIIGNNNFPQNQPLIFCSNYQSNIDPYLIFNSLPDNIRKKTYIVAQKEFIQFAGFGFSPSNIINLKSKNDPVYILKVSVSILNDGNNILVFPESGKTITGEIRQFKSGIGLILLEKINANVIPIRIKGTFDLFNNINFTKMFAKNKIRPVINFGNPISLSSLIEEKRISPYSTAEQISAYIRSIITDME
jgi:long-chain acyl-CoA synthetase